MHPGLCARRLDHRKPSRGLAAALLPVRPRADVANLALPMHRCRILSYTPAEFLFPFLRPLRPFRHILAFSRRPTSLPSFSLFPSPFSLFFEIDNHLADPSIAFSQCLRAFRPAFWPHFSKCDCSHRANELQIAPCFNITVKMRLDHKPIGAGADDAPPWGQRSPHARRRHRPSTEQISSMGVQR